MPSKQHAYLAEMGIEPWQVWHPERLEGVTLSKEDLPVNVRLLLIAPNPVALEDIPFLEKVLTSFDVALNEVRMTQPNQLFILGDHTLEWVWFVDCDAQSLGVSKSLVSRSLDIVSKSPSLKKSLWQQIQSYKEQ
jgi:DNA polymerase-3 subunit psi